MLKKKKKEEGMNNVIMALQSQLTPSPKYFYLSGEPVY